jgi:hypothetical protein
MAASTVEKRKVDNGTLVSLSLSLSPPFPNSSSRPLLSLFLFGEETHSDLAHLPTFETVCVCECVYERESACCCKRD